MRALCQSLGTWTSTTTLDRGNSDEVQQPDSEGYGILVDLST